jgi:hypothetical protein
LHKPFSTATQAAFRISPQSLGKKYLWVECPSTRGKHLNTATDFFTAPTKDNEPQVCSERCSDATTPDAFTTRRSTRNVLAIILSQGYLITEVFSRISREQLKGKREQLGSKSDNFWCELSSTKQIKGEYEMRFMK